MPRLLKRLLAIVLGLFVALALLEAGLRAAALFASPAPRAAPPPANPNERCVFFVGDSHIYGVWVKPDETLPAIAQALAARYDPPGFAAVNLGRAAAPSWVARAELQRALAVRRPAAVVVRAGFNNHFSAHPTRARWYDSLRVTRLLRISIENVRVWARGAEAAPRRDGGDSPPPVGELRADDPSLVALRETDPNKTSRAYELRGAMQQDFAKDVSPGLRADLLGIIEDAKGAGARVFLLPYFDHNWVFDGANGDLAWAARESGSTLVDLAPAAERALARWQRHQLLFDDGHPRPLGYALEAATLISAMRAAGFLGGAALSDPVDSLASVPREADRKPPRIELSVGAGGIPTIRVHAEPEASGRILLGNPGEAILLAGELVALEDDAVSRTSLVDPRLRFTTDPQGWAEVAIPNDLGSRLPNNIRILAILGTPGDPLTWPPLHSTPIDCAWPPKPTIR
jgi:hypothetical protein